MSKKSNNIDFFSYHFPQWSLEFQSLMSRHRGHSSYVTPGQHFIKLFVPNFHWQMLKATEIIAFDWLRASMSVKITDKMLHPAWFMHQSGISSPSSKLGRGRLAWSRQKTHMWVSRTFSSWEMENGFPHSSHWKKRDRRDKIAFTSWLVVYTNRI